MTRLLLLPYRPSSWRSEDQTLGMRRQLADNLAAISEYAQRERADLRGSDPAGESLRRIGEAVDELERAVRPKGMSG